jgi:hypothetical protein
MIELWAWRIGMLVLAGIPAIVGGGLVWHFIPQWKAVLIWGIILMTIWIWILSAGGKRTKAPDDKWTVAENASHK